MSKRYIPQTPNNDFVYPNNDKVEYDENIVHEINDNTVSGTISGLTLSYSGPNLQLQYTYEWSKNGADTWVRESGNTGLLSVHMLAPNQEYFSAWRIVDSVSTPTTNPTVIGPISLTRYISPSSFGLTSWPAGQYTFEFRFIGLKQNYIICETATLAGLPTPTPTSTPCTCNSYSITNDSSESQLTYTYVDCDTGVTNEVVLDPSAGESRCACSGSVTITIGTGTIVDLGPCAVPTPTPTPTSTSTPTPTPTAACTYWYLVGSTQSGELLTVDYNDCAGNPQSITLGWSYPSPNTTYICAQTGSVVIVDQGIGSSATNTGTPCS